jgi:hypothetical protein
MVAAGLLTPEQAAIVQAAQNGRAARNEPPRSIEDTLRIVLGAQLDADLEEVLDDIEAKRAPDYKALAAGLALLLIPSLMRAVIESATREAAVIGVDFDIAVINQAALAWSKAYTYDLIKGLTDTTRGVVQEAISTFVKTPGMTRGELSALLEPAFGARRAEMIAVTETTRAFAEGTREYQRAIARMGVPMQRIWRTSMDEKTCPVCAPNEDKTEREWEPKSGPPAHPRCRCFVVLGAGA